MDINNPVLASIAVPDEEFSPFQIGFIHFELDVEIL